MTTHQHHDPVDEKPKWIVQTVFDPDRSGQDFSYTIGLHDHGRPELHLWAHPNEGTDPGEDWSFSDLDRSSILQELAIRLMAGRAGVGHVWTETYDEGEAKVTFTVQPPGDRDFLQAWGTRPEAVVLPVSWSLERPPVGEAVPLAPAAVMEAYEQLASLVRHVPRGAAPAGWERVP